MYCLYITLIIGLSLLKGDWHDQSICEAWQHVAQLFPQ